MMGCSSACDSGTFRLSGGPLTQLCSDASLALEVNDDDAKSIALEENSVSLLYVSRRQLLLHPPLIGQAGSQLPGNHPAVYGAQLTAANEAGAAGGGSREGALSELLSHASHVPGCVYTQVHTSSLGFKHPPTGARVSCLKAIIGSPHLVHHHPPPHQPVTNIDTAKEGAACVITIYVQKVSERKSVSVHSVSEVFRK